MKKRTTKRKAESKRRGSKTRVPQDHLGVKPVEQDEPHTCGLCACSALYKFFKVPTRDLRERLGVDNPPVPAFSFPLRETILEYVETLGYGWGGTLPMDLCEVIWEDGFAYDTTTDYENFQETIASTLSIGYPAFALINGLSHWVVVAGARGGELFVVDSLCDKPYWIDASDFEEIFNGAIAIYDKSAPREPGLADYLSNYISGAKMGILAAGKEWIF